MFSSEVTTGREDERNENGRKGCAVPGCTLLPRAALTQLYLMCYTFVVSIAPPSKYEIEKLDILDTSWSRAPKPERRNDIFTLAPICYRGTENESPTVV